VLAEFDEVRLDLPTAPCEVFRLFVRETLTDLGSYITNRRVIPFVATVRADCTASFRLIFPQAGGVLMVLYFVAGIAKIVAVRTYWVKKSPVDSECVDLDERAKALRHLVETPPS
jgi:hypothetical protein